MSKIFWFLLVFFTIFVNDNLIQIFIAISLAGLSLSAAINDAIKYMTFKTFIFALTWRVIPYFVLSLVIKKAIELDYSFIKPLAWGGLMGIVVFITTFTWLVLEPIYTDEKYSSAAVISIILIPIFSIISCGVSSMFAILFFKLCRQIKLNT
jgi:hypothetical protein